MGRRWDVDERGHGVADARQLADGARELVDAMVEEDWVAEDPDAHLLPHIRMACDRDGAPLSLRSAETEPDGTLSVALSWRGSENGSPHAAAFALLGEFAESTTYIRYRRERGALVFDVVTGMLATDTTLEPHGHTVRFTIEGAPR